MSIVTLVLFGNLAASLTLRWPFRRDRWKEAYSFIFVNFLFFPTILAIAVLGAVDPNPISRPQPNAFASLLFSRGGSQPSLSQWTAGIQFCVHACASQQAQQPHDESRRLPI
jgi:hypothetical protein